MRLRRPVEHTQQWQRARNLVGRIRCTKQQLRTELTREPTSGVVQNWAQVVSVQDRAAA